MPPQTLVIHKDDISKHEVANVPAPPEPLSSGSVRVQPKILSLTRNNLTYAALGSMLKWWDTYLVAGLPAPYNDAATWGIVPSWGYAEVIETGNKDVPLGKLLYGYWPTSSAPIDVTLQVSSSDDGLFMETSEHRKEIMPLYNQYHVVRGPKSDDDMAWTACVMSTWQAGAYIDKFVFPRDLSKRLGPMGEEDWSKENADLRQAVIVSLAASSKTAMGFDWNLGQREKTDAPLALLRVSNSPKDLPDIKGSFDVKETDYTDLPSESAIQWVVSQNPSRVIVVDFGSTGGASAEFQDGLLDKLPESADLLQIWVGRMPDGSEAKGPRITSAPMNTSPLLEKAETLYGAPKLSREMELAFAKFVKSGGLGDMQLQWGAGVDGERGLAAAWNHLVLGTASRKSALVFRMT